LLVCRFGQTLSFCDGKTDANCESKIEREFAPLVGKTREEELSPCAFGVNSVRSNLSQHGVRIREAPPVPFFAQRYTSRAGGLRILEHRLPVTISTMDQGFQELRNPRNRACFTRGSSEAHHVRLVSHAVDMVQHGNGSKSHGCRFNRNTGHESELHGRCPLRRIWKPDWGFGGGLYEYLGS
jgi:hypothetical protein